MLKQNTFDRLTSIWKTLVTDWTWRLKDVLNLFHPMLWQQSVNKKVCTTNNLFKSWSTLLYLKDYKNIRCEEKSFIILFNYLTELLSYNLKFTHSLV